MKARVFAAGLGTRLRPLTDTLPKALVPVGGRPLLDIVLRRLRAAGADDIVVNAHHFAYQIKDFLALHDYGVRVQISDETDQLLDTGGGLRRAAALFASDETPILIHNVDILSNADLPAFYREATACDALLLVSERETSRYLLFNEENRLVGWTNVKTGEVRSPFVGLEPNACKHYAFSGIHCFSPRLLPLMQAWPDKFSIIDFYLEACAHADIRAAFSPNLRLLDVGKPDALARAEEFLKEF
ncbi:MAG: nucleotidyltransferase family protein [Alloprevotella sp.]|nr:nucleotidyltransferase family protein [Alloprevotella sp.]